MITLTGTKEEIFDAAVKMISESDYDSINLRELAGQVGIKAASIYNHFSSKQEILDLIYSYYRENFNIYRKNDAEIKNIIDSGSKDDIIDAFAFTFSDENPKKRVRMVLITKIIYMRIFKDKTAHEIFSVVMVKEPTAYIKGFLDYGIRSGRFENFDTKAYSEILNGVRNMTGIKALSSPDNTVRATDENHTNQMLANLLPIKK